MQVRDQSALVVGGASGLGAATARALAGAGARVAVLDRDQAGAETLAEETGGVGVPCDVTDAASAEAAVAAATQAHGAARILVNCAGVAPAGRIAGRDGPHDLEAWSRVIQINLVGTFNLMRLAVAAMQKLEPLDDTNPPGGERGVVINTASVAAYEGQMGQSAYAASKGGVAALTLPAARELARDGIRVVAIAPGTFSTPMLHGLPDEVQQSLADQVPFPSRLGDPAEFAALALHICENPMLNGEVIRLDGALRMPPR